MVRAGKSYDEIGRALGYANRGSVWRLVQHALQSKVIANVDDHRAIELERLDALQSAHWQQAQAGDARSAQVVLRVIEHRTGQVPRCLPRQKASTQPRAALDVL